MSNEFLSARKKEFLGALEECRKVKHVYALDSAFSECTIRERNGHFDLFFDGTLLTRNVSKSKDPKVSGLSSKEGLGRAVDGPSQVSVGWVLELS